jgi:hypothetical protein
MRTEALVPRTGFFFRKLTESHKIAEGVEPGVLVFEIQLISSVTDFEQPRGNSRGFFMGAGPEAITIIAAYHRSDKDCGHDRDS